MQAIMRLRRCVPRSQLFRPIGFCTKACPSVLVTGGAAGIGEAISRRLAKVGYKVAVCDITMEGKLVAEDIGGTFIQADVTKPAEVEEAVAHVVKTYGKLDAMVNNAGVVGAQVSAGEYAVEEWKRVMDVNLNGAFYVLKFSLAQMAKQPTGGNIVNMSSIAGGRGMCNLSPYTAAKWALRGLTQSAAVEYCDKNIRVNAVAPTAIETPMVASYIKNADDPVAMQEMLNGTNALPGLPQPSDVASAVAFLLSDEARYITGHTLPVDAGAFARLPNRREIFNVK